MSRIIGIDLGTSNSCVAVLEGGKPMVLPNAEGARTTPSVVAFMEGTDTRLVGQQAKRQAVVNPGRTIHSVKRLIGRRFRSDEVATFAEHVSYKVCENLNGDAWVEIDHESFSPQEISAQLLAKMKSTAEDYFGESVHEAVVTVPAYFDDAQRQATKEAARVAGLTVKRILNEPTAAALAYGFKKEDDATLAVFDLGGGTFDISIVKVHAGVFEVIATSGDNTLGGNDFDEVVMRHLMTTFAEETGLELRTDPVALQRVREASEQAKCELSTLAETNVNLPFLSVSEDGPKHLNVTLTRETLNQLCADLIDRLDGPCVEALEAAGLELDEINDVLLVGGMTRMPLVQERVESLFRRSPRKGVNPDEVVAMGAAIQSGILGGEIEEVVLMDVTPLALGIRVVDDRVSVLIKKNTSIPVQAKKVFTTTEDNQEIVSITVVQGPSEKASECRHLGNFHLTNIPRKAAGEPRIEVEFEIDSDGIVNVSAEDLETHESASIVITNHGGLSDPDVKRAVSRTGIKDVPR